VILVCYSLQVFCTGALVMLARNNTQNILAIYTVLFFIGTGRAFSGPASSALIPHLVPEIHFVNAVTWGGAIFQFANITGPALGGLLFTFAAGAFLPHSRLQGAGIVYVFTLGRWCGSGAGEHAARAPGRMEHRDLSLKVVLAGFQYVRRARLLLGSFRWTCLWCCWAGDGADADLCARDSAPGAARAGHVARGAGGGRSGDVADPWRGSRCIGARALAVCLRVDLRRSHGGLRAVAHFVAVAGIAGGCGRGRHGQRDYPRVAAATGHAAGDARARERGELAVYWRVE
jgi:MFS family permease